MMADDEVADEVEEEGLSYQNELQDLQSSNTNQGTTHDNGNTTGIVCVHVCARVCV